MGISMKSAHSLSHDRKEDMDKLKYSRRNRPQQRIIARGITLVIASLLSEYRQFREKRVSAILGKIVLHGGKVLRRLTPAGGLARIGDRGTVRMTGLLPNSLTNCQRRANKLAANPASGITNCPATSGMSGGHLAPQELPLNHRRCSDAFGLHVAARRDGTRQTPGRSGYEERSPGGIV